MPTPSRKRPRVYLAGPEVFLPEAKALGEQKAAICTAAGLEGLFPLDQTHDISKLDKAGQARVIALADEEMMRACDAAIANLTPFRGVSMDSGTAFEVGFMRALGRPVLGYSNVATGYRERAEAFRRSGWTSPDFDRPDAMIEDFDLAENLMIEVAIRESGGDVERRAVPAGRVMLDLEGFRACVTRLAGLLGVRA